MHTADLFTLIRNYCKRDINFLFSILVSYFFIES